MGGFGDFFIAVGVLLLGIGLFYGLSLFRAKGLHSIAGYQVAAWLTFATLVMWGLAEYLTGRLKLVAPSIVAVVFMTLLAVGAATGWATQLYGLAALNESRITLFGALAALGVALLHYGRFRFPFSLLLIAVSSVVAIAICASILMHASGSFTSREIAGLMQLVVFACGTVVFGAAMWFDASDPERLTRRSDCAFWLHIVAAPLIVHPLAAPLIGHPIFGTATLRALEPGGAAVTSANPVLVFPLILALALIALIVDRRALLVAGLGYLGAAMTYSISRLSGQVATASLITLIALGLLIIVLGVYWHNIRGALMRLLPDFRFKNKLPPYAAA